MSSVVRFGVYEADLSSGELRKGGVRVRVRPQSFLILAVLVARPGQLVTREEMQQQLWGDDVSVDFENSLNTAIAHLREVLCDSADHPRYIETIPRRGYRFISDVYQAPAAVALAERRKARLLVLPFANLTGDPSQEYLGDAITDEIITEFASLAPEHLAVIARTTAMHYKGTNKDIASIGRELNVDYIVEGGVRRTDHRVWLNLQLIQTSDETHLFAAKHEAALGDIFRMQSAMAQTVAAHIPLIRDQACVAHTRKTPTKDAAALHEYVVGRQVMEHSTADALVIAIQHFETAIARDPDFAHAYDALAEVYWYLGYLGFMSPRKAFSAGIVHALRALEIDDTRAETHALLGQFHKIAEYNWDEVEREMQIALRLDPGSPVVRTRYAVSGLMPHGRLDEAIAELDCALELDPLSVVARTWLGIMLVLARRYDGALEEARKLLELDPAHYPSYFVTALAYRYQGKIEASMAAQRKAVELSGGAAAMLGWYGLMLAAGGQTEEARGVLQRLTEIAATGYAPPCSFAWVHLGLKELDKAFEWLDRAVEDCDQLLMPIKNYGILAPIRGHPRLAAVIRKMRLEPQRAAAQ